MSNNQIQFPSSRAEKIVIEFDDAANRWAAVHYFGNENNSSSRFFADTFQEALRIANKQFRRLEVK